MFHLFKSQEISSIELPALFTNPFDYEPHPLVRIAAEELCDYLKTREDWHSEIDKGKMFGVLVVKNKGGELGYLAAFSGYLDKCTRHSFFVPPICDLLDSDGFFRPEERVISQINEHISELETNPIIKELTHRLAEISANENEVISNLKEEYLTAREHRRTQRAAGEDVSALALESQRQKGNIRRAEMEFRVARTAVESQLAPLLEEIKSLKNERATRSAALQREIFRNFIVLNSRQERKDLLEIFDQYNATIPPAGSGECAAPKLLHYAYRNSLTPIAIGEFWRGESPRGEVRHDMHYYTACRGKCHPILSFMLQGLNVEPPTEYEANISDKLSKIYEDEALVAFNKPSGLATVRGLNHEISLQSIVEELYPTAINHHIVHRLDMDTSGVVIIAKSAEVQRNLQRQFAEHTIRKRYIALVEGVVNQESGSIELPLIMDPMDRPRQRVDFEQGKSAYTHFVRLKIEGNRTRLALYPHTGRTHQLRVHCAHAEGLASPIVGDRLYGNRDERLMLHAEQIVLKHPTTLRKLTLSAEIEF